jgi:hypothetical protein
LCVINSRIDNFFIPTFFIITREKNTMTKLSFLPVKYLNLTVDTSAKTLSAATQSSPIKLKTPAYNLMIFELETGSGVKDNPETTSGNAPLKGLNSRLGFHSPKLSLAPNDSCQLDDVSAPNFLMSPGSHRQG